MSSQLRFAGSCEPCSSGGVSGVVGTGSKYPIGWPEVTTTCDHPVTPPTHEDMATKDNMVAFDPKDISIVSV